MSETVHFSLGDNAGKLLMQIAYENLTIKYDPQKALEIITKSLHGITIDLALGILCGKLILIVNDDDTMSVVNRDENKHKDYPIIDISKWVRSKRAWIIDKGGELYDFLFEVINEVASLTHGEYQVNIDFKTIIEKFLSGDKYDLNDFEDVPELERLICACEMSQKYLNNVAKLYGVFNFFKNNYPKSYPDIDLLRCHEIVDSVSSNLKMLTEANMELIKKTANKHSDQLENFITHEIKNSEILEKGIHPVEITDNYSAGWLAPNGDFYGLNGEVANMLHIKIANALVQYQRIPESRNPDSWLSRNGWVKIHGDWVLYDGYMQYGFGMDLVPLTEIQKKRLSEYGQTCHNNMLRCGCEQQPCSADMLDDMDEKFIARLFDYRSR